MIKNRNIMLPDFSTYNAIEINKRHPKHERWYELEFEQNKRNIQ